MSMYAQNTRQRNIAKQKFGDLTAMQMAKRDKKGNQIWLCSCSCGATRMVLRCKLIHGRAKSCGNRQLHPRAKYGKRKYVDDKLKRRYELIGIVHRMRERAFLEQFK